MTEDYDCDGGMVSLINIVRLHDGDPYCHLELWRCESDHLHLTLLGHVWGGTGSASAILLDQDLFDLVKAVRPHGPTVPEQHQELERCVRAVMGVLRQGVLLPTSGGGDTEMQIRAVLAQVLRDRTS